VALLRLALLLESPLEPALDLLLALSLEAVAPLLEPFSELLALDAALEFPFPPLFSLLLLSLTIEALSELPSDGADPEESEDVFLRA
jgi:hypothetical protein